MKLFKHISLRVVAPLIMALLTAACGDDESFTVEGFVEEAPTMNIRYVYYAGGRLNQGLTAAKEGKFEIKGVAAAPTVLSVLDNEYRPLGRVYVSNGDRLELKVRRGRPYDLQVSGNETSERWASCVNSLADSLASPAANRVIERYVAAHTDDIVSTLLMMTSYDASADALRADSVMSSIDGSARPSSLADSFNAILQRLVAHSASDAVDGIDYMTLKDSLLTFNPYDHKWSLIVLSSEESGRSDSIGDALDRLPSKRLHIIDLGLDREVETWRRAVRSDTVGWQRGWVAGSVAAPGLGSLGVPSLPYFIIVDATGRQALRTTALADVERFVGDSIK